MAHIYFEAIHPFEDGNGRIGRASSEKALSPDVSWPTLTALEATVLVRFQSYRTTPEAANRQNEICIGWGGLRG